MFETSFNETENYSEILVEIAWLRNCGDLRIKLKKNYLTILCVFEFKGFHNEGGGWGHRAENLPRASHDVNPALPPRPDFEGRCE
jgi:hypothetical protein